MKNKKQEDKTISIRVLKTDLERIDKLIVRPRQKRYDIIEMLLDFYTKIKMRRVV